MGWCADICGAQRVVDTVGGLCIDCAHWTDANCLDGGRLVMNKLGKIAPLIVIVACLGSLFFVFKLSGQKKDLKQENTTLASARQTAERERDTARNDLQTAKTAMAKMTEDLTTAKANLQAA